MERTHRAASCGTVRHSGKWGLILKLLTILADTALPLGAQAQQAWGEGEGEGEGENWTQSYGMTPAGGDRYTIWPSDSTHFTTELRPC